jgi:hypothetical protein
VDRGRQWLRTWLGLTEDDEDAAFMVLTACRIWHLAAEGSHLPKVAAGGWALGRRPSLIAVRQAIRRIEQDDPTPFDPARVAAVLQTVLRETE